MYQLAWRASNPLGPGQHRGRARFLRTPAWQIQLMHPARNGDQAGATPAAGSPFRSFFSEPSETFHTARGSAGTADRTASEAENLGSAILPEPTTSTTSRARQSRRGGGLQPRSYPVRVRGARPFPPRPPAAPAGQGSFNGGVVQPQDSATTSRRSRCKPSRPHHLAHEGVSKPAPFGSARHLGQHQGARPLSNGGCSSTAERRIVNPDGASAILVSHPISRHRSMPPLASSSTSRAAGCYPEG